MYWRIFSVGLRTISKIGIIIIKLTPKISRSKFGVNIKEKHSVKNQCGKVFVRKSALFAG